MPTASLNRETIEIPAGLDDIVVVQALSCIPGGRTLDVSGLPEDVTVIKSGHILIVDEKTKAVSPLNITGSAYDTLPEGKKYYGVLKVSIPKRAPFASIITAGQINAAASPAPVTDEIKTALSRIEFLYASSSH